MPRPTRWASRVAGCLAVLLPATAWAQSPEPATKAEVPKEQEAPKGLLNIGAPIKGAVVYIDNVLVGPVPATQYLTEGAHFVRVTADGYDPFVRKISIRAGTRSNMTATMTRGGSTVEFQANASAARVSLDGAPDSPVPVRLKDISVGTHKWKVTARGYEPAEGSFDFASGQNIFVVAELQSSRGLFVVETEPAGATVRLDGNDVGQSPVALEDIAPGEHVVDISLDGYARELQLVDTSDGAKGHVQATLSKGGGKAVIKTGASDAEVRYKGVAIGAGSKVVIDRLARGRYGVEVIKPGSKPATGRVRIDGRGRKTYKASFADEGSRDRSRLTELPPMYARWTFWTAVGIGAGGALTGGIIAYQATKPIPIPEGDVVVTLP
jgi:hypothetical protein